MADCDRHDLEYIVTCLELGALHLTPHPNATFTYDQLLAAARSFAPLDEQDIRIVLPHMKCLQRRGELYSLV